MTRVTAASRIAGMSDKPISAAERVRASEDRKIAAGGRRMPGGVMPADAASALDVLMAEGYGTSASGCIYRAIVEAAEQFSKRR